MGKDKKFDYINEQWLIDNWVNTNLSMATLAKREGCSESLIDWRRTKYKLKKAYKYKINMKKLKDINDPILYYFAGLLSTDGWMWKERHYVEIDLVGDSEKVLLEALNKYYENGRPVKQFPRPEQEPTNRLTFSQQGIREVFIEHFNIPLDRKTFNVGTPKFFPTEDCARMYVRGCMDGDGSIFVPNPDKVYSSKPAHISTALYQGSEKLALGLIDIVNQYVGTSINLTHLKGEKGLYPGFETGGMTAQKFLDWLYIGYEEFRLARKYDKYKSCIRQ
jgi:hypothetical protein